jgi:gamma-glutamylcyclotransferase (GGCT)/AIG2-like uncharacterized protein YtfP
LSKTDVLRGDLIAVYGLLRAGESGFAQFGLADAFKAAGPCIMPGDLYDLGAYPGLVLGKGRVLGELFEVVDVSVKGQLDAFEDYWPDDLEQSRYERVKLSLIDDPRSAWVYVWRRGVENARFIDSGDWLNR